MSVYVRWNTKLCSEAVVRKEVLSSDDAFDGTVARVDNAHVASVVQTELVQDLVELVVQGHGQGALNHVGTQINPLLEVLLDHIKDNFFSISLT